MDTRQKSIAIYLAALVVVAGLMALHLLALQQSSISLRIQVERQAAGIHERTYRIHLTDAKSNAPLSNATVLVITQARGSDTSEILVVATETNQPGVYTVRVPFSHDGSWFLHIGLNRPIATHVAFPETIQGTTPGPPIPVLQADGEPVGTVTVRTLADGYAFLAHLAGTAVLGLALALLFVSRRRASGQRGEMGTLGTHLFWASIIVLLSTGLYNYVYHTISEAPVPLTLNFGDTWRQFELSNFGNIYAVVLAAKHLAILALIGVGATIGWTWHASRLATPAGDGQKARVWATSVGVILGAVILLLGGMLVYLHAISGH